MSPSARRVLERLNGQPGDVFIDLDTPFSRGPARRSRKDAVEYLTTAPDRHEYTVAKVGTQKWVITETRMTP